MVTRASGQGEEIFAGLDVGAYSIKCVVAEHKADGAVDILGTGCAASAGIRDGMVNHRGQLAQAIRKAVEEAALMSGCDISSVHVAIGGPHLSGRPSFGLSRIQGEKVSAHDVAGALALARAVKMEPGYEVLHTIPREYVIDGQGGITRPEGMPGVRLEVNAHLIIGVQSLVAEVDASCLEAGLEVLDFVFAPLAAAETLLRPEERELGVVLVDIGGSTTDVTVFQGGALLHTSAIPVGGEHVTSDVRDCLHTPTVDAERLKHEGGCALTHMVDPDEEIEVPGAGGRRARNIRRALLCEIIEARMAEILAIVAADLREGGFEDGLPGGVVLTGGSTTMPGVIELTEEVLGMPTTRGEPHAVTGLVDAVRSPRYATGCGLVRCAALAALRPWETTPWREEEVSFWSRIFKKKGGR